MCKQMQQPSNIDASMLVVLSNNVGTCSVSWERYFNPYTTLKTIGNVHVWLTQCCKLKLYKRIQHRSATLWWSQNKRNVGSCWLKHLTSFKLCTTTPNDIQQHATGYANRCKMLHSTMLGNVGQQCCVRSHRALQLGGDWWISFSFGSSL